eukprot:2869883-Pyramimonas_sp.AAC.1
MARGPWQRVAALPLVGRSATKRSTQVFGVFQTIQSYFNKAEHKGAFNEAMAEIMKYAVPSVFEGDEAERDVWDAEMTKNPNNDVKWLLKTPKDCKVLTRLFNPMATSK